MNVLAIAAIAFAIATIFTPVVSFSTLDIYHDYGIDEPCEYGYIYWKTEYTSFLSIVSYVEENVTFYAINFPFFVIYSDNWDYRSISEGDITQYAFSIQAKEPSSRVLSEMSYYLFGPFFLFGMLYFFYKGMKYCDVEKAKWFFYSGFLMAVAAIGIRISYHIMIDTFDPWPYGNYTDYIVLEHGFIYMITSSILFFTAFIIQNYFVDYDEDKPEIEKNLFERYQQ